MRPSSCVNTIKDDAILGRLKFIGKGRGQCVKEKRETVTPKKKSSITVNDNIIPDPDEALKLGKSISKIKAEIAEKERQVHATHECLITEKQTNDDEDKVRLSRIKPTSVVIRDTPTVSKKKLLDQSQKLKGIQVMTEEE
ncbi:hypothetical protein Tco_0082009, partial [Tanacetum coccineum]